VGGQRAGEVQVLLRRRIEQRGHAAADRREPRAIDRAQPRQQRLGGDE
jgi:hypothetical protein